MLSSISPKVLRSVLLAALLGGMSSCTSLSRPSTPAPLLSASASRVQGQVGYDAESPYGSEAPAYNEQASFSAPIGADIHFGGRILDSDSLDEVDQQFSLGFSINNHDPLGDEPFGYEFSGFISQSSDSDDGTRVEGSLTELAFGLRRNFRPISSIVPYLGAGVSVLLVEREQWTPANDAFDSDSELALGLHVHGGAYVEVGADVRVGVDLRAIPFTSQVELMTDGGNDEEGVDSYQATIFVGVSL